MPVLESVDTLDIKYRPIKLGDLVGQDEAVNVIKGMLKEKKIDRTIMLYGPSGSGKTTLARMIARYVNCIGDKFLCDKCYTCMCEDITLHNDVHEMNMASATGVDNARELISQSRYMPQTNFRVFILDEMHMISTNAKECLLKSLENPSPRCLWILCTTEPDKFKDTVLGRCTKLQVKPVDPKNLFKLLKKVSKAEKSPLYDKDDILMRIAELVNGQPRDGLKSLGKAIHYLNGKGSIDPKELDDYVKKLVNYDYFVTIQEYLLAVYLGNLKLAISKLKKIGSLGDYGNFLNQAIQFHNNALFSQLHQNLVDNMANQQAWVKVKSKKVKDLPIELMSSISVELVKTLSDMKNYLVQSYTLAIALTCKLVNMVNALEDSFE